MENSNIKSILCRLRTVRYAAKQLHDDLLQMEMSLEQSEQVNGDKQCTDRFEQRILQKIAGLCDQSGAGYAAHEDLVRRTTNIPKEKRYTAIESLIAAGKIEKLKGISDRRGPAPIYYRMLVDVPLPASSPATEVPLGLLRK